MKNCVKGSQHEEGWEPLDYDIKVSAELNAFLLNLPVLMLLLYNTHPNSTPIFCHSPSGTSAYYSITVQKET